jgi:hypothetical protein
MLGRSFTPLVSSRRNFARENSAFDLNDFPKAALKLQGDLETVVHNLKLHFPNIKIAYFSSRTRAYVYWEGANPEPGAFETGLAVKWMIGSRSMAIRA